MPLPTAVACCSWSCSIALSTSSRLRVGGCTSAALPAKATMPMRVVPGMSLRKARAAACAAASRVGFTSSARMLPETSIARITVSCCEGNVTTAAGRAHQRAARAAGIGGGVELDQIGEDALAVWRPVLAPEPRDHAVRHRRADAEREADGGDMLAFHQVSRRAQRRRVQIIRDLLR